MTTQKEKKRRALSQKILSVGVKEIDICKNHSLMLEVNQNLQPYLKHESVSVSSRYVYNIHVHAYYLESTYLPTYLPLIVLVYHF